MMRALLLCLLGFAAGLSPLLSQESASPDALVATVEAAYQGWVANPTPETNAAYLEALRTLGKAEWTLSGTALEVRWGRLDRLTGLQSVVLKSRTKEAPFEQVTQFSPARLVNPDKTRADLAARSAQGQLVAEVRWSLLRTPGGRYEGRLTSARLLVAQDGEARAWLDLGEEAEVWEARWTFAPGQRGNPTPGVVMETATVKAQGRQWEVGVAPVTEGQYQALMKRALANPPMNGETLSRPVRGITWLEAVRFCNQLSLLEGRQPVYRIVGARVLADFSRNGWRLPRGEEWDVIQKGEPTNLTSWNKSNSGNRVPMVATTLPNAWNLYDTVGTVRQWLSDEELPEDAHRFAGLSYLDEPGALPGLRGWSLHAGYADRTTGFRVLREPSPRGRAVVVPQVTDKTAPSDLIQGVETAQTPSARFLAVEALQTARFQVTDKLRWSVSSFDRELKQWTWDLESLDPEVPYRGRVTYSIRYADDLARAYQELSTLLSSSTFRCRLEWRLEEEGPGRYRGLITRLLLGTGDGSRFQTRFTAPATGSWLLWAPRSSPKVVKPFLDELWVPGGSWTLGQGQRRFRSDSEGRKEEKDRTPRASVSSFWMTRTAVTQAQYQHLTGQNPSHFASLPDAPRRPVDGISWFDAVRYANALSLAQGLTPVYDLGPEWQFYPVSLSLITPAPRVVARLERNGWRLPTSAEYEWAARGGLVSRGTDYAGSNDPEEVGWTPEPTGPELYPVAQKVANELGLFDLSGNGTAWTGDWSAAYPDRELKDYAGPPLSDQMLPAKVVRGYGPYVSRQRAFDRSEQAPTTAPVGVVLRLVRRGPPPEVDSRPGAALLEAWNKQAVGPERESLQARMENTVFGVPAARMTLDRQTDSPDKRAVFALASRDEALHFQGTVTIPHPPAGQAKVEEVSQGRLLYRLRVTPQGTWEAAAIGFEWGDKTTAPFVGSAIVPLGKARSTAATGGSDDLWAVNSLGTVYQRSRGQWAVVQEGGTAVIAGADASAWVINAKGKPSPLQGGDKGVSALEGVSLAVGPQGDFWALGNTGVLRHRTAAGTEEVRSPVRLHKIAVGKNGEVWALGGGQGPGGWEIYAWQGGWRKIEGRAIEITVDSDGNPWVVNADHRGFRWTGQNWVDLPGSLTTIAAGISGAVWALGSEEVDGGHPILRWTGEAWQSVEGAAVSIAVP